MVCALPSMRLTSAYYLGLEQELSHSWIIQTDFGKIIELRIIDFYVKCEQTNSLFKIKEVLNDIEVISTYCNKDRPSSLIYSTYNRMTVEFSDKQSQPPSQIFPEGFKASYRSVDVYENIAGLLTYEKKDYTTKAHTGCSDLLQKCYILFSAYNINWKEARVICNKRGFKMVVIHSETEMQFIRALFVRHNSSQTPSTKPLQTYIGLTRYIGSDGVIHDVWVDGKALIYSAWNTFDQRDGYMKQCSRMTFNLANKNNTWESIDCDEPNKAEFFVCENTTSTNKMNNGILLTNKNMTTFVKINLLSLLYQCPRGEWITLFVMCNGYPDCLDGSDEINCTSSMTSLGNSGCPATRFRCNNGRCIDLSRVCNYIIDCADGEDEFCEDELGCHDHTFKCADGRCIDAVLKCNGISECYDNSDENSCDVCSEYAFQCDDLSCIPQSLVCDGFPDCGDGRDENNCGDNSCLQLWKNGFKQSGDYVIGGYNVVCDFDYVPIDQRIRTIIKEIDIDRIIPAERDVLQHAGYVETTFVANILYKDELFLKHIMREDKLSCSVKVVRTCAPWVAQLADVDDVHRNLSYSFCENITVTNPILKKDDDLNIVVNGILDPSLRYSVTIECLSKPLSESYTPAISCGVGHVSIKTNRKCLYDSPRSKFYNGCRSNMHLQQCRDFQCPSRYVKCPSSYCIQPRLVCDGVKHCPNGEDENNCWCKRSDSSVTIVYYGHADDTYRKYIFDLGRQFVSMNGEVRLIQVVDTMERLYDLLHTDDDSGNNRNVRKDIRFELLSMLETVRVEGFAELVSTPLKNEITSILTLYKQVKGNPDDSRYEEITELLTRQNFIYVPFEEQNFDYYTYEEESYAYVPEMFTVSEQYLHDNDNIVNNKLKHAYSSTVADLINTLLNYSRYDYENDTPKNGIILFNDIREVKNQVNYIKMLVDELHKSRTISKSQYYIYTVQQDKAMDKEAERNILPDDIDVNIQDWNMVGSKGFSLFTELCQDADKMECRDGYMCMNSRVCIYTNQLCDNLYDCPFKDDEMHCDFWCRPRQCQCEGKALNCSNTGFAVPGHLVHVSSDTRSLDISFNNITELVSARKILDPYFSITLGRKRRSVELPVYPDLATSRKLPFLLIMNVSSCHLSKLGTKSFEKTKNLLVLDISNNRLTSIITDTFRDLRYLTTLILEGNSELQVIEPGAFNGLINLNNLYIRQTSLKHISMNSFVGLKVTTLDISYNKIEEIESFAFSSLDVKEINIEGNDIMGFSTDIFTGVSSLQSLRTPAFKFCCIRPSYLHQSKCLPEADEFSSCEDLMRNSALQTLLWLIGFASVLGNAMSVTYRLVYDRKRLKLGYGIFVTNLAVADFLMGVYLIIIASADVAFRKRYIFVEYYWRHSAWCNMAGMLSTISSEASVFFLLLITLDRILVIKYPFGQVRFTPTTAMISAVSSWIVSITIALIPLVYESYFQNLFYTRTGVCLALPLSRDRPPGWMYSIMVFIVLYFVTFVLVACGQLMIFMEVQKQTTKVKRMTTRRNDLTIARNLLLVVTTDFLCWFPIGCMGIMALNGHVIPGDVYAWTAVLILPIISALNPFLYTLSAMLGNKTFVPRLSEQNTQQTTATIVEETKQQCAKKWLELLIVIYPQDKENVHGDSFELTVAELSTTKHRLSLCDVVTLSRQLSFAIYAMHRCDVSHGHISPHSIQIGLTQNYQIGSGIIVKLKPRLCNDSKDQVQDIYEMGCVIRKIMMLVAVEGVRVA